MTDASARWKETVTSVLMKSILRFAGWKSKKEERLPRFGNASATAIICMLIIVTNETIADGKICTL
jgi:hypothetical protein